MNLQDLKDQLAIDACGMTAKQAWDKSICIECKQPAVPKCHTAAGRGEYRISAMCEECFDSLFAEGRAMTTTAVSRFVVERQPMICGQSEAQNHNYKIAVDEKGCVWLYDLTDKSPSSTVYVDDPNDEKSDGFGGATLTFKIGKCGLYTAKGPWHGNADALYEATKIDLRDKCLSFVVVARNRSLEGWNTVLEDILFIDDKPTIGNFYRYKPIAQKWADDLGVPVFYHSETSGGSSNGPVNPTGWTDEQSREWWRSRESK